MPSPGVVNNESGVNGFNHFAPEPPYGAATNQKRLQQAAPLASGRVAAGAINAPKQDQRAAQRPQPAPAPIPPPGFPPPVQNLSAVWAQIAATPGASPLVQEYAAKAAQQ